MIQIEKNTARYFELLAKEEQLRSEGKSLIGELFRSTENEEDGREFLEWKVIFSAEICFGERNQYLELIKNYLEEKIDMGVFWLGFSRLWYQRQDSKKRKEEELRQNPVSTIWVDSRAPAFSGFVSEIFSLTDSLSDEVDLDDDYDEDLAEEKYRKEIQEIYLKMKEVLQEE